ncbi:MAG: DUF3037 domain-containing protein [Caldilineaceae bacterium]|nr:DUF3037 domain-containing protein [Caldilineaceae bacterium]
MPTLHSYDYAYIQVVPRVERCEFINAGVILFCRTKRFLNAAVQLDEERLRALAPYLSPRLVRTHLELIPRICAGEGPIGQMERAERFHWLVAPHSTIIQSSPVHSGLCSDPAVALATLTEQLQLPLHLTGF